MSIVHSIVSPTHKLAQKQARYHRKEITNIERHDREHAALISAMQLIQGEEESKLTANIQLQHKQCIDMLAGDRC